MAEPEVEAAWRAEFKRIGDAQLRDALNSGGGFTDELKRQAVAALLKCRRAGSAAAALPT